MAKFILGKKLNMTQKFTADGAVVPVTVIEAGPCVVVQVKKEKDGYRAIQVGYGLKKKLNKPQAGHLKGLDSFRYLKEFRLENIDSFERGKSFGVNSFETGDIVDVRATSKGKGFQGVVKRHGFAGSPATHGHKDQLRMPGSIGSTDPARVFKGTRMGGRMGTDAVKLKNLEVVEVDAENNLIYIKGAVPGHRGSLVEIVCPKGEISFLAKEEKAVEKENTAEQVEEATKTTEEKVETAVEEKEEKTETVDNSQLLDDKNTKDDNKPEADNKTEEKTK